MKATHILSAVRARIEWPKNHVLDHDAADDSGYQLHPLDPRATAWSIHGALRREGAGRPEMEGDARRALERAARIMGHSTAHEANAAGHDTALECVDRAVENLNRGEEGPAPRSAYDELVVD